MNEWRKEVRKEERRKEGRTEARKRLMCFALKLLAPATYLHGRVPYLKN